PTYLLHTFIPIIFCHHTAPAEIYTLSLHDALPISAIDGATVDGRCDWGAVAPPGVRSQRFRVFAGAIMPAWQYDHPPPNPAAAIDRKSTRLNSSHVKISYAVFCLKKKNRTETMVSS